MSPGLKRKREQPGRIATAAVRGHVGDGPTAHRPHAPVLFQTDGTKSGACVVGNILL